ncbi:MAG: glycosyl transferase family 1, partial [Candidatus Nealsonbacteria bacterium CG03_land_8_20_14_0_80_36_12]
VEHFGMTTVEAMSAGCVPIVINKGGQKEIIQNNKDGFLWETSGDLIDLTEKVINDDKLMSSISEEAVKKSRNFSKKKFYEKIYNFIG